MRGSTLLGEMGVRDHDSMCLATWLGIPESLTLVFSHLMKDLLPDRRTWSRS